MVVRCRSVVKADDVVHPLAELQRVKGQTLLSVVQHHVEQFVLQLSALQVEQGQLVVLLFRLGLGRFLLQDCFGFGIHGLSLFKGFAVALSHQVVGLLDFVVGFP